MMRRKADCVLEKTWRVLRTKENVVGLGEFDLASIPNHVAGRARAGFHELKWWQALDDFSDLGLFTKKPTDPEMTVPFHCPGPQRIRLASPDHDLEITLGACREDALRPRRHSALKIHLNRITPV